MSPTQDDEVVCPICGMLTRNLKQHNKTFHPKTQESLREHEIYPGARRPLDEPKS